MSPATRRDSRAWPPNERCLARDSAKRDLSFTTEVVRAAAPAAKSAYVVVPESINIER
jgi:hypothetical protein